MRARTFFINATTYSASGGNSTFDVTGSNSSILATNTVFEKAIAQDAVSNDPYGDINLYTTDRTVIGGSVAVQFTKSSNVESSTDIIHTVIVASRS